MFSKLVRDRIPEIMRAKGKTPIVRTLDDAEYDLALRDKLHEEVEEFLATPNAEEAADIAEVLLAILARYDVEADAVESVRRKKREERGGFEGRYLLELP